MTTTEANLISNVTFQGLLYNKRVCLLSALQRWNSLTREERCTNISQLKKKCISREQENYMEACDEVSMYVFSDDSNSSDGSSSLV